jgi:superfamily II DNA or RNA helicase
MKLRDKLQAECVDAIRNNSGSGIIDVAPRFGKSKTVIDYLRVYEPYDSFEDRMNKTDILITVPRNTIIDSWKKELEQWWPKYAKRLNVKIINQRSIEKEDLHLYDHLILDEIHSLSERQLDYIRGSSDVKLCMLGLSGSINPTTKKKLKDELDLDIIYQYTVEQAIADGIIANYEINVITCKLNTEEAYIVAGSKVKRFMTTEQKNYNYFTKMMRVFAAKAYNANGGARAKLNNVKMSFASKRADLIYKSKTKARAAKELIDSLERCLIFTGRIETAESIGEVAYHSKSKVNELERFIAGEVNKLAVCEMVDMGITIPNLKVGVFHQMKSNNESAIQKVLRMCNLEGGETAKIYIFMYEDTQDEVWVKKALEMFDESKINYVNDKSRDKEDSKES